MDVKRMIQDTQLTTSSGATFAVAKDWFVAERDDAIILQEPDRELTITLIENNERTAQEAVLAAWKKVQPDFARVIQHALPSIPQGGWDEHVQFMYETTTQENRFIFATARRVGATWYIQLIDGAKAALERRMAGALLVDTSFKVPGMHAESFADKKAQAFDDARLKEYMQFIENARVRCKIPGAAVGIVHDGKLIFEQGFGVRMLGQQLPVTPQTLFMIGSTTKALTTFMMARLVDEKKFSWDTPVTQLMPDFALGDAATTQQVLMKYMVSANTGIPRQDFELLFNYDATPESRLKEMRTMKPTTGFGEVFQYSNSMVAAGGYIAAHTVDHESELGKAYDAAMQAYVFDALGMSATTFDFAQVAKMNHAMPHGLNLHGEWIPLSLSDEKWIESIRPAGGIWSNVHDMAQYMITELNNGINVQGTRLLSEGNLLKRRDPQIKITDTMSYGLGLIIENHSGVVSIGHGGGTMGFSSQMFFLPEHNVGLVVLANARGASVFMQAVQRKVMELLFDGKSQAQEMIDVGIAQQATMIAKNRENIVFKPDVSWLAQFTGTYLNPVLGEIAIREVEGGVALQAPAWKSSLGQKSEQDGTRKLILTELPFAGLEFVPQLQNGRMQLVLQSGQHTYIFEQQ